MRFSFLSLSLSLFFPLQYVKRVAEVVIVGTLYKEMPLKPSILDEYAKDRGIVGQILKRQSFISPEDMLVLEDGACLQFGHTGLAS